MFMYAECSICYERKRIKKFINFCDICCNLVCDNCTIKIEDSEYKNCPFCRSEIIKENFKHLRKSYSIINNEKYKDKKELIATAYCFVLFMQTRVYKSFNPDEVKELIENAKKDIGPVLPKYIFDEARKISFKRKKVIEDQRKREEIIQKMLKEKKYDVVVSILRSFIVKEDNFSLSVLYTIMKYHQLDLKLETIEMIQIIEKELIKRYNDKYKYIFLNRKVSFC